MIFWNCWVCGLNLLYVSRGAFFSCLRFYIFLRLAMSASYGATTELLQGITTVAIPHSELYIRDSNVSMTKSGCFSRKFLVPFGLCKKVDCRSKESSIIISMSSRSRVETAEDDADRLTYKDAGVDIDAGSELVRRIAKMAPGIGGFGGLYPLGLDPLNLCFYFFSCDCFSHGTE